MGTASLSTNHNQKLHPRWLVATSAANLQRNLSYGLKCLVGLLTAARGCAARPAPVHWSTGFGVLVAAHQPSASLPSNCDAFPGAIRREYAMRTRQFFDSDDRNERSLTRYRQMRA
jgi:hypothetical protein